MAAVRWMPKIMLFLCLCLSLISLKVYLSPPVKVVEAYNQGNLYKIRQVDNLNP
jgi:hypothetical protein